MDDPGDGQHTHDSIIAIIPLGNLAASDPGYLKDNRDHQEFTKLFQILSDSDFMQVRTIARS